MMLEITGNNLVRPQCYLQRIRQLLIIEIHIIAHDHDLRMIGNRNTEPCKLLCQRIASHNVYGLVAHLMCIKCCGVAAGINLLIAAGKPHAGQLLPDLFSCFGRIVCHEVNLLAKLTAPAYYLIRPWYQLTSIVDRAVQIKQNGTNIFIFYIFHYLFPVLSLSKLMRSSSITSGRFIIRLLILSTYSPRNPIKNS